MKHLSAIAIAMLIVGGAYAQDNRHGDNPRQDRGRIDRQVRRDRNEQHGGPDREQRSRDRSPRQPTFDRSRNDRWNHGSGGPRFDDRRDDRWNHNSAPRPPQVDRDWNHDHSRPMPPRRHDWDRPGPGPREWHPRPGWRPDYGHRYHNTFFVSLDIFAPTTFYYSGRVREWNPTVWRYTVDRDLATMVVRSERISNAMRESFERQMRDSDLRSTRFGADAWDDVQRLDESLERLRADVGFVPNYQLRDEVEDTLSRAQDVSDDFDRYGELRDMTPGAWDDLRFELNQLAGYFDEPGIR